MIEFRKSMSKIIGYEIDYIDRIQIDSISSEKDYFVFLTSNNVKIQVYTYFRITLNNRLLMTSSDAYLNANYEETDDEADVEASLLHKKTLSGARDKLKNKRITNIEILDTLEMRIFMDEGIIIEILIDSRCLSEFYTVTDGFDEYSVKQKNGNITIGKEVATEILLHNEFKKLASRRLIKLELLVDDVISFQFSDLFTLDVASICRIIKDGKFVLMDSDIHFDDSGIKQDGNQFFSENKIVKSLLYKNVVNFNLLLSEKSILVEDIEITKTLDVILKLSNKMRIEVIVNCLCSDYIYYYRLRNSEKETLLSFDDIVE